MGDIPLYLAVALVAIALILSIVSLFLRKG